MLATSGDSSRLIARGYACRQSVLALAGMLRELSPLQVPVMTQLPGLVHSPLLVHSFVVWFEQVPSERKPRMRWLPLSTTYTRSGVVAALRWIATPWGWKVRLATIWLTT